MKEMPMPDDWKFWKEFFREIFVPQWRPVKELDVSKLGIGTKIKLTSGHEYVIATVTDPSRNRVVVTEHAIGQGLFQQNVANSLRGTDCALPVLQRKGAVELFGYRISDLRLSVQWFKK